MATIYQMKQNLGELGAELTHYGDEIRSKAGDPNFKIEELRELKNKQAETEERYNMLKSEIEKKESEERDRIESQQKRENPLSGAENKEQRTVEAKADLIRSAILSKDMNQETRNLLGALPAPHASGGDKFLPTTLSNELIHEPFVDNPLRGNIRISNVTGLEVPRISFTIDDDNFIGDEETAKEIKVNGDKVSFGRNKFKVKVTISDTVLHGSPLQLVSYVENSLRSGLAAKEKKVSFASSPIKGEELMSFYSTENGIKEVEGESLYEAIVQSAADLHEDFRQNAKIVMRYSDYTSILKYLANSSSTFYGVPPETILGYPVIYCDYATTPIVGDFNYAQLNYDGALVYDSDKNVDKGEYLFVLTGWLDQKILLKSAFRRAKVIVPPTK
ncbi:phage major capsid protein [Marininema halotolerans]|uniref:Phage major capsid protein, HK97 family n=1 Tax=Marininema halotolerans TaxID=1155944 RepID=A0A1I6URQ8_9BACL|nr:phage major capsid protein [Marininema halotolerans]SFT04139.1 phage major capsid protein, HK97 family [Marininema halotolerans]